MERLMIQLDKPGNVLIITGIVLALLQIPFSCTKKEPVKKDNTEELLKEHIQTLEITSRRLHSNIEKLRKENIYFKKEIKAFPYLEEKDRKRLERHRELAKKEWDRLAPEKRKHYRLRAMNVFLKTMAQLEVSK